MRRGCLTFQLALLASSTAACGGDRVSTEVSVERVDSAGIEIVVNHPHPLAEWRVAPDPFVTVGTASGGDGQDLGTPWASHRMADGRILISDAQANELRVYGRDGRFEGVLGRGGDGPGEFGLVAAIYQVGEVVVVADAGSPRLNLYDADLEFRETITVDPIDGRLPRLRGVGRDRQAVFRTTYFESSEGRSRAVRDTMRLVSQELGAGPIVELGRYPAAEKFNQIVDNGSVAGWSLPFGRDIETAVAGEDLWIGVSDRAELMSVDLRTGAIKRIARLPLDPAPVGAAEQDLFFAHQLETVGPAMAARYTAFRDVVTFPPTMPAFSSLLVDELGAVWVEEYRVPWADDPPRWTVLAGDGTTIARVQTPVGFRVHKVGADYLLGSVADELGIQTIRVYELERE